MPGNRVRPRSFEWVWAGAGLWGLVGAVIAWRGMSEVNADAKRWVGIASTVLPLCSVAAALLIKRRRNLGVAGGLLLVSTGTPTYFAWPVNIIPILLIVGLVIAIRKSGRGALHANSPSASPPSPRRSRSQGATGPDAPESSAFKQTMNSALGVWPVPLRWGAIGAVSMGVLGGVAGLVVGLFANARTAWFAIFELGVPSAIIGGLVGLASGAIASAIHHTC